MRKPGGPPVASRAVTTAVAGKQVPWRARYCLLVAIDAQPLQCSAADMTARYVTSAPRDTLGSSPPLCRECVPPCTASGGGRRRCAVLASVAPAPLSHRLRRPPSPLVSNCGLRRRSAPLHAVAPPVPASPRTSGIAVRPYLRAGPACRVRRGRRFNQTPSQSADLL